DYQRPRHNTTSTSSTRKPDLNCNENSIVLNGKGDSVCVCVCVCGWLGVVTPSVVALCASIKLGSRFIGGSCLKHPPKRSSIFAVWAVDTGGWKRLNGATIHDLERNVLSGLLVQFFPALFFNPFSLKAAFWAGHALLISGCRPQACLAFWAKTQSV
ncbi:MAG: hypothetical protein MOP49_200, partial [Nitrososphaera sp.]|nr:hypothetical protein [Nitrososphaera sp.]